MELEKILIEVTQTQKYKSGVFSYMLMLAFKLSISMLHSK